MRLKATIAAIALAGLPTFAAAAGCNWGEAHTPTTAMSCAAGTVYDAASGTCVPSTTS
ncbi:MAG: carbohydrate-binding module family 14 protein [Pseudomonadota bacterium]